MRVRFLSLQVQADGPTSWVTVTRTGRFSDPRYGQFDITPAMLAQMVRNFDSRVLGQDVFLDVEHQPANGAAAKVLRLAVEGSKLRALVQWTDYGKEAVNSKRFCYLSAEYHEDWRDNEQGIPHGCVLLGAALTTRPVVKHLDAVGYIQLSEGTADDDDNPVKTAIHPKLLSLLENPTMWIEKFLSALRNKLLSQGLSADQIKSLVDAATTQLTAAGEANEPMCLSIVSTFEAAGAQVVDQVRRLSAAGNPGAANTPIVVQLSAPAAPQLDVNKLVADAMAKQLSDQRQADEAARTALAGQVKLLTDTVADLGKSLSEEQRTGIVTAVQPLVTTAMTADQIKTLAQLQVTAATQLSAAQQLAGMGYRLPDGTVRIEVVGDADINKLQAEVDRRLGITRLSDADRYRTTGGKLLAKNKAVADAVLQQYDRDNGHRLLAESKMLAGGTGVTSDVVVPASYERTVVREMLYQLVGLNFVNTGSVPFTATAQIPFSYRDTTAAGVSAARTYEGQGIKRAGVKMDMEEARPIPQKLAFHLSNELRYLLSASLIDFDPLAENTQNLIRMIGEDTDGVIHNEVLLASDEAYTATITDTLTAQCNGTNKVFVTTQFPVVRPRKVFDLKGNQVGTTTNPLTVTLGGTVRSEYQSGVTLAAGTYYVMDYNLGELRFVSELGAAVTPANATVLSVAYTYTLNVTKFDLDKAAGETTLAQVYDRMLTQIGARKVEIENNRYYTANLLLMSGAVDNSLGVATTFQANSSRPGYGLNPDGSVGQVKGIPVFNTKAPGLQMGDVRILLGEQGNTRFRMMKPWSMNGMNQARDTNGLFIGAQEDYGDQFIVCMTPSKRKNATTTLVQYSSSGRVARVA